MERISREAFIRLGAALGVGAATASLAACGGGGESGNGSSGGGSGGGASETAAAGGETTMMSAPAEETTMMGESGGSGGGAAIAQEADVAPGSAVAFKDGGKDAVLVHLDSGDFVAYSAICTHAGCRVEYTNGSLFCPCHGSLFDSRTGAVLQGPATQPLATKTVVERGGTIYAVPS